MSAVIELVEMTIYAIFGGFDRLNHRMFLRNLPERLGACFNARTPGQKRTAVLTAENRSIAKKTKDPAYTLARAGSVF